MSELIESAWIIAVLPFLSFVIALVAGKYLPKKGAIPGILATAASLAISIWAFFQVYNGNEVYENELYTWVGADAIELTFGILIDPLSALMLIIVSLIATLVHIFSLGYMNHDPGHRERGGLPRYYASLGLFTASMLAFVFSSNLLMAFIFFELVGLCSYLLIGFWQSDRAPSSAAKKAFLVTRFGDYFFLIGVVGVLATFGTGAFYDGFPEMTQSIIDGGDNAADVVNWIPGDLDAETWFTILGLLVLGGVIGKSAQFPLHTWLPDAMEGPTPVSALIHAATMVAAGVYLVARMFGFYAVLEVALIVIAFIGGFTALFAATMGVVKDDLKQVLAYSTISQYGYMMLGLGVGGYVAATFHLMNHAYFKALLFLGAGAIIVATHHHQDMWKLGGLKDKMPIVHYTFLAGALALAGVIPLSGFWSKDEILYDALLVGLEEPLFLAAYGMALLSVFLTGFYTFRMYFLTFHGEPRSEYAKDPEPLGWDIKFPLGILGILAVVAGLVNMKPVDELVSPDILYLESWLDDFGFETLAYTEYTDVYQFGAAELAPFIPAGIALALALAGIYFAHLFYNVPSPAQRFEDPGPVAQVVKHNYYQDEIQVWIAQNLGLGVARSANTFDQGVIDGIVNGAGGISLAGGDRVRRIQSGFLNNYILLILLSLFVLTAVLGVNWGWWL